jgi:hypothetical protein
VVHKGAQCHQTGADGRQDAHQIRVSALAAAGKKCGFLRNAQKGDKQNKQKCYQKVHLVFFSRVFEL